MSTYTPNIPKALKLIAQLRKNKTPYETITKTLNKQGLKPMKARKWTVSNVQQTYYKYCQ